MEVSHEEEALRVVAACPWREEMDRESALFMSMVEYSMLLMSGMMWWVMVMGFVATFVDARFVAESGGKPPSS
jgi:hypothetical protein